jgi:hypothetical protein
MDRPGAAVSKTLTSKQADLFRPAGHSIDAAGKEARGVAGGTLREGSPRASHRTLAV